jgi:hypothetical protein
MSTRVAKSDWKFARVRNTVRRRKVRARTSKERPWRARKKGKSNDDIQRTRPAQSRVLALVHACRTLPRRSSPVSLLIFAPEICFGFTKPITFQLIHTVLWNTFMKVHSHCMSPYIYLCKWHRPILLEKRIYYLNVSAKSKNIAKAFCFHK